MNSTDPTQDPQRAREEEHLRHVQTRLEQTLKGLDGRLQHYRDDIQEQKTYAWEARSEMDHVEKIAARESIQQAVMTGEAVLDQKRRLTRLLDTPYFGRFDFRPDARPTADAIYIGLHHFFDEADNHTLIHDWRAPIATLFYDYETGPAHYTSPKGEVAGEIQRKRQFRIRQGRLEMMLDTTLNVVDDVLQDALSRSSDEHMRNIVATIQRDQNAIIRDEHTQTLIIQGVAGSGKTSIALHRIAFLLYRFKETLTSEDILIISPNQVFADYIANVLPELGEESIQQISMDTLADKLLESRYRFQTFYEQACALVEKEDPAHRARVEYKASADFLKRLDDYAAHMETNRFDSSDLWIARRLVPGWLLEEIHQRHRRQAPAERIRLMAREVEQKVAFQYHYDLLPEERKALQVALKERMNESSLRETYKGFFTWMGQPELFKPTGGKLEYADVFPLIYLKRRLEGLKAPYPHIKHLVIDEMQDYTPVQYAVLARLFQCNKTILGDAHQAISPYGASGAGQIRDVLMKALCVTLNKSYRSTLEITRFAQGICHNPDLEPVARHGEAPQILACRNRREEMDRIKALIEAFQGSEDHNLCIIYKTRRQAKRGHEALQKAGYHTHLIDENTASLSRGVMICTAHLAKGLEFDRVIVPEADDKTYRSDLDRNLLYVACTRAMHRLTLTHTGNPSPFCQVPDQHDSRN
ncbi:3'-5' exonuclease [Ectothiorhodospira sp. BSL-9]|uniref:HelD family protein n=1 Tax=Ectothiorhodospira sp. BSL-9 TaxID=1442136 RepID=UPI0007B43138|nr:3'-5' exonuclease [Ectothiorhodospira sp. BSL-9]ANB03669.1 helicase [Ectothiorhodospira sp. BSL-9]